MNKRFLLASLLLLAPLASAQVLPPTPSAAELEQRADFAVRMDALAKAGDWPTLLSYGLDWQTYAPNDPNGWWTAGKAAYNLGDIDAAIRDYTKGDSMSPPAEPDVALITARKARVNFPHLKLQPLQFVNGDATLQEGEWQAKGIALLHAKSYDEIEKVARDLQKSNAHTVKDTPFLDCFFQGLCDSSDPLPVRQSRVAAWKAARPNSALARIAAVQLWTDEAWHIRGDGYANTITPEMSKAMDAHIARGFANLQALPPNDFDSPLAFLVALQWGQIASAPRSFYDKTFAAAIHKFPNYAGLYQTREYLLMPRWFGEPGELEAFVTHHADALGGVKGDIFYARMVWPQIHYYENVWRDTGFLYPRFKRGMLALAKAQPDSISVPNVLMRGATFEDDNAVIKQFFASPKGNLIVGNWWTAEQEVNLPEARMQDLAK